MAAGVAAVEWDVVEVIIQRVGIGMVPEMVLVMEQRQEKALVMGPETGPKKLLEPGTVMVQVLRERAGETERINCIERIT